MKLDIDEMFDQLYKLKREQTEQEKREAAEWRGDTIDPLDLIRHGIPFCFVHGGGVLTSTEGRKRAERLGLVKAPSQTARQSKPGPSSLRGRAPAS